MIGCDVLVIALLPRGTRTIARYSCVVRQRYITVLQYSVKTRSVEIYLYSTWYYCRTTVLYRRLVDGGTWTENVEFPLLSRRQTFDPALPLVVAATAAAAAAAILG